MKEYKTSILVGILYILALVFLPFIRTISVITLIFLTLQFLFHGVFVLLGDRADRMHRKFTETYFATITALGLYGISTGFYFLSLRTIF